MQDEIINKVANSVLEVFDLEDYYAKEIRTQIDISQWLYEGFLLKEKDFREELKNHDWSQYENHYVAIHCSTDAIIPAWASILVTIHVSPFAKKAVFGSLQDLETSIYQEILSTIDYSKYQDKPVIIKGCSKKPVPESAYILAVQKLQPFAKSIMYGEACSAVPLFKRK
ncbi:DUF2480 family protein [Flavobacterium sp.]|uniref:DUF2480 family protein n=1 Tax=Flavobacterium sp. TaxID=239 RepID=UPI003751DFB9